MTICDSITIRNASENNLHSVSLDIPKNKLIVVTGVSGSGKSSLIFDVLYREAEFRYLGSFTSYARQFLGKMKRPEVEMITGLSPAIAAEQKPPTGSQRSTVGTITGIYDYLRLLYARIGRLKEGAEFIRIDRSLFSFNTPDGACPACNGLGVEDRLDPELMIADKNKTLRNGALVITAPNGYIIYSQVTMEVLDQVCRSEGFNVDIPWKELTPEQKHVVLYGSDRIEIPYGKHPLESRMRWTGITAKPREMGTYKGILPVMENILKRDRNKNILRFVRSCTCPVCNGSRLNQKALSVQIDGIDISMLTRIPLDELQMTFDGLTLDPGELQIAQPILQPVAKRIATLKKLGLGHLTLHRESTTLSGGESHRLRLAAHSVTGLRNVLYLFDEPSVGLHSRDIGQLIGIFKELRDQGNTVIVVEHDEEFIFHADWLIDMGPGPGIHGGKVILNSATEQLHNLSAEDIRGSQTLSFYGGYSSMEVPAVRRKGKGTLIIEGASENNLKNINATFILEALNVVTGVSGAGKSSLTFSILNKFLRQQLSGSNDLPGKFKSIKGWEGITKIISIDQSPIGRTPRSNPATYTGVFDHIRDLYASLPDAKERNFTKSHFSFNTPGGRCESCQGAGYQQIGMHFMGNVEILCETCNGRRFDHKTREILYREKTISDVLELSVSQALTFFHDKPEIIKYLATMEALGLGYLTLGQRSSTLSGGEAQRIKLATELAKPPAKHTLYILDEPTTGLHQADIDRLRKSLDHLIDQGHTVILIEHHLGLIAAADHIIDLGPESGRKGGFKVFEGPPEELIQCRESATGQALKEYLNRVSTHVNRMLHKHNHPEINEKQKTGSLPRQNTISFTGVTTHNLKNINVEIPHNQITVLTGVSGSGKSSLAFNTIYAEGQSRFLESFSAYARTRIGLKEQPDFETATGLTPTFAVDQRIPATNPRSTVGTHTGIYDLYRLLFSRIGLKITRDGRLSDPGNHPLSSLFSFNHQAGACPACDGLGLITVCDPDKLITHPDKSILDGAMEGTRTGKFYGDPYGQYVATLKTIGKIHQIDFTKPWMGLTGEEREIVLHGTGENIYDIHWTYKRMKRQGEHHFKGTWQGLTSLVNEEYRRKHADHRGESMMGIMTQILCPDCEGTRLNKEALEFRFGSIHIACLSSKTVSASAEFFNSIRKQYETGSSWIVVSSLIREIQRRLETLTGLGLSYLTIDRPVATLSHGEIQRIKLSEQINSGLTGITYLLDEPTMGLHPSETERLIEVIRELKNKGNTIVIVEHDRKVIRSADYMIDLGPGAGIGGGNIVAQGTPEELIRNPRSVTGKYLPFETLQVKPSTRILKPGILIRDAHANNLKGFDLHIPSGGIIVVAGVSGSGKSSLMYEVVLKSQKQGIPQNCKSIEGFGIFKQVVTVSSKSHFSGSLGIVATYTGIFDRIRTLFSDTADARRQNFGKDHFSFLNRKGQCAYCRGEGEIKVSMDFLSDVSVTCEHCQGKRYHDEILTCYFNGKNISQVLTMTVAEATCFFREHAPLATQIGILDKVGLGYLQLGQSLDTLSGGEAQRLVLATELMKPVKGNILYFFDEPSTGLHFSDIHNLVSVFQQLVEKGHTILMIENDPDILVRADWIINLGPGKGDDGGRIVAQGSVSEIYKRIISSF